MAMQNSGCIGPKCRSESEIKSTTKPNIEYKSHQNQYLHVSRLAFRVPFLNPFTPGVKSKMKT